MTRAMKKARIRSAAAQQADNYAANKVIRQLRAEYADTLKKNAELEAELKKLKQELVKIRASARVAKRTHQSVRSANIGQIKSFRLKLSSKGISPSITVSKVKTAKRSHKQYLAEVKPQFIDRFINRMAENFDLKVNDPRLIELRNTMSRLSVDDIDTILLSLDSLYRDNFYESYTTLIIRKDIYRLNDVFEAFGKFNNEDQETQEILVME